MENNIKSIRESKGITQKQLADKIGKSRFFISKIENNKSNPSMLTALMIAHTLDVTVNDIIKLYPSKNSHH